MPMYSFTLKIVIDSIGEAVEFLPHCFDLISVDSSPFYLMVIFINTIWFDGRYGPNNKVEKLVQNVDLVPIHN